MCENLAWQNCYHSTDECKNKNVYTCRIKINLNEVANDTYVD